MAKSKIIVIILLMSSVFTANAQISNGAIMIGGNAGLESQTVDNSSSNVTTVVFNPMVGYFLSPDFALGGSVTFFSASFVSTSSAVSAGPFARYYIAHSNFFGQVNYFWNNYSNAGNKGSDQELKIDIGYSSFINQSIAFEPSFFWGQVYQESSTNTVYGFRMGFQIFLRGDK